MIVDTEFLEEPRHQWVFNDPFNHAGVQARLEHSFTCDSIDPLPKAGGMVRIPSSDKYGRRSALVRAFSIMRRLDSLSAIRGGAGLRLVRSVVLAQSPERLEQLLAFVGIGLEVQRRQQFLLRRSVLDHPQVRRVRHDSVHCCW
jgi:hypothetical protein